MANTLNQVCLCLFHLLQFSLHFQCLSSLQIHTYLYHYHHLFLSEDKSWTLMQLTVKVSTQNQFFFTFYILIYLTVFDWYVNFWYKTKVSKNKIYLFILHPSAEKDLKMHVSVNKRDYMMLILFCVLNILINVEGYEWGNMFYFWHVSINMPKGFQS